MKLVDIAIGQIGVEEDTAHTNMGEAKKYQDAVGLPHNSGFPWCQSFVYWCAMMAYGAFNQVVKTGGVLNCWNKTTVPKILKADATAQNILPGFQFILDFGHGLGHTGIVEYVDHDGTLHTIEGNSNPAGGRDGYCVARHIRHLTDATLKGFICYTDAA